MIKDNQRKAQSGIPEDSAAKGGREALKPDQQEPQGIEPDSVVDEKLRRSQPATQRGLEPNTIVRN